MASGLKGRDVLTVQDFSVEEINFIFAGTTDLKLRLKRGELYEPLKGKTVALVFENRSTRTRASFEVAVAQLGGHPMYIWHETAQTARGEPIKDAVRVWARYCDAIVLRALELYKGHDRVCEYAKYADVPVINACTDLHHPCQILCDIFTILEKKGELKGLKLAFSGAAGYGGPVCHDLAIACTKLGIDITIAVPKKHTLHPQVTKWAEENAKQSGARITITDNIYEAAEGADVVYNDELASPSYFKDGEARRREFAGFTVTDEVMKHAKPDAIYMHCLPAIRGEEVTDEVLEGPQSVIFDQAENRLHIQKMLLALVV